MAFDFRYSVELVLRHPSADPATFSAALPSLTPYKMTNSGDEVLRPEPAVLAGLIWV